MDNAQALFDRLLKDGKTELDKLVIENTTEHYFLDFKRKSDSNGKTPLGKDDDANLGKALSGFANAQGGVIIWGMDKKDKPNRMITYALIQNPHLFVESLNRRISEIVTPFVDGGVDNRVIFEENNAGVVATYIPESQKTPHRSLSDNYYYTRSGDSFRKLEHATLEDMFGRRSRPKLSLKIFAKFCANSKPNPTYNLNLVLTNEGRAISQLYGFDLDLPTQIISPTCGLRYSNRPSVINHSETSQFDTIKYRNTHDNHQVPLFPTESITLSPNDYYLGHIQLIIAESQMKAWVDLPLKYKIYSENMQTIEWEMKFGDLFK